MFDSRTTLTLRHLTTRQNVTVHHVSIMLGIPLRPTRELLEHMSERGFVRSSVRIRPKGVGRLTLADFDTAETCWTITPLGRLALAQGQRDSRATV